MRRFLFALGLSLPLHAFAASSFTSDASDLWWNSSESGWGVNISPQSNVGTFTFLYSRPNSAIVSYTADGAVTSKTVRRQTWATNDISGEYYLNRVLRTHRCGGVPNTGNEPSINEPGIMTVSRAGDAVQVSTRPVAPSTLACTYTGNYSQEGRMSRVEGTFSCNDGTSGPFTLSEIEVSKWGFIGRISTMLPGCFRHGHFGGTRVTVEELPS